MPAMTATRPSRRPSPSATRPERMLTRIALTGYDLFDGQLVAVAPGTPPQPFDHAVLALLVDPATGAAIDHGPAAEMHARRQQLSPTPRLLEFPVRGIALESVAWINRRLQGLPDRPSRPQPRDLTPHAPGLTRHPAAHTVSERTETRRHAPARNTARTAPLGPSAGR